MQLQPESGIEDYPTYIIPINRQPIYTHDEHSATGFRVLVVVVTGLLLWQGLQGYSLCGGTHHSYQIPSGRCQK